MKFIPDTYCTSQLRLHPRFIIWSDCNRFFGIRVLAIDKNVVVKNFLICIMVMLSKLRVIFFVVVQCFN